MRLRRRLRRWAELSVSERMLLVRAVVVVFAVRVGLWTLPLRHVRRLAALLARASGKQSMSSVVWAVRAGSRCVPGASCLPQALAVQGMLAASGFASRVEIGVARDEQHSLQAHAWVTCGDQVVIGGPDVSAYQPITVLDA